MKTQIIIFGLIGVIVVFYLIWIKFINKKIEPNTDMKRSSNAFLPKQEKQNDKLVIVDNVTTTEIDSILTGFCNMYNEESFQALPRLYKLGDGQFAITFPFDIEFEMYCYFVNYAHYPMGFDKSFDVTAWTTTKTGQTWITEKTANKLAMLFVPSDDVEYDNVYLTTSDNIGYKLGFAVGEEKQLLDFPKKQFISPKFNIGELRDKKFDDFK